MPVLIHTDPQSAKSLRDFPLRLLVEGSAPKPLLNTEFHPVAVRSANALKGYAKTLSPLRCPETNRSTIITLRAAVKHSSHRLMCEQNAYPSFVFTSHPVPCFWGIGCRETRHPMVILGYPKMGPLWDNGVAKHHPIRDTF